MALTPGFFNFLVENRLHDSKPWFEEHREEYTRLVLEPLRCLSQEMAPLLLEVDPQLVTDPKIGKTISRIFRDTRFSRDKSIFREVMWLSFCRPHLPHQSVPSFFLELSPEGYCYGCGCYASQPDVMEAFRGLVLAGDKDFLASRRLLDGASPFVLDGECYKRSKHPTASPALRPWLDRKAVSLLCRGCDPQLLYSPDLGPRVARDLAALAPLYRLLWKAQAAADAQAVSHRAGCQDW